MPPRFKIAYAVDFDGTTAAVPGMMISSNILAKLWETHLDEGNKVPSHNDWFRNLLVEYYKGQLTLLSYPWPPVAWPDPAIPLINAEENPEGAANQIKIAADYPEHPKSIAKVAAALMEGSDFWKFFDERIAQETQEDAEVHKSFKQKYVIKVNSVNFLQLLDDRAAAGHEVVMVSKNLYKPLISNFLQFFSQPRQYETEKNQTYKFPHIKKIPVICSFNERCTALELTGKEPQLEAALIKSPYVIFIDDQTHNHLSGVRWAIKNNKIIVIPKIPNNAGNPLTPEQREQFNSLIAEAERTINAIHTLETDPASLNAEQIEILEYLITQQGNAETEAKIRSGEDFAKEAREVQGLNGAPPTTQFFYTDFNFLLPKGDLGNLIYIPAAKIQEITGNLEREKEARASQSLELTASPPAASAILSEEPQPLVIPTAQPAQQHIAVPMPTASSATYNRNPARSSLAKEIVNKDRGTWTGLDTALEGNGANFSPAETAFAKLVKASFPQDDEPRDVADLDLRLDTEDELEIEPMKATPAYLMAHFVDTALTIQEQYQEIRAKNTAPTPLSFKKAVEDNVELSTNTDKALEILKKAYETENVELMDDTFVAELDKYLAGLKDPNTERVQVVFLSPPDVTQAVFYNLDRDILAIKGVSDALKMMLLNDPFTGSPKERMDAQLKEIVKVLVDALKGKEVTPEQKVKIVLALREFTHIADAYQLDNNACYAEVLKEVLRASPSIDWDSFWNADIAICLGHFKNPIDLISRDTSLDLNKIQLENSKTLETVLSSALDAAGFQAHPKSRTNLAVSPPLSSPAASNTAHKAPGNVSQTANTDRRPPVAERSPARMQLIDAANNPGAVNKRRAGSVMLPAVNEFRDIRDRQNNGDLRTTTTPKPVATSAAAPQEITANPDTIRRVDQLRHLCHTACEIIGSDKLSKIKASVDSFYRKTKTEATMTYLSKIVHLEASPTRIRQNIAEEDTKAMNQMIRKAVLVELWEQYNKNQKDLPEYTGENEGLIDLFADVILSDNSPLEESSTNLEGIFNVDDETFLSALKSLIVSNQYELFYGLGKYIKMITKITNNPDAAWQKFNEILSSRKNGNALDTVIDEITIASTNTKHECKSLNEMAPTQFKDIETLAINAMRLVMVRAFFDGDKFPKNILTSWNPELNSADYHFKQCSLSGNEIPRPLAALTDKQFFAAFASFAETLKGLISAAAKATKDKAVDRTPSPTETAPTTTAVSAELMALWTFYDTACASIGITRSGSGNLSLFDKVNTLLNFDSNITKIFSQRNYIASILMGAKPIEQSMVIDENSPIFNAMNAAIRKAVLEFVYAKNVKRSMEDNSALELMCKGKAQCLEIIKILFDDSYGRESKLSAISSREAYDDNSFLADLEDVLVALEALDKGLKLDTFNVEPGKVTLAAPLTTMGNIIEAIESVNVKGNARNINRNLPMFANKISDRLQALQTKLQGTENVGKSEDARETLHVYYKTIIKYFEDSLPEEHPWLSDIKTALDAFGSTISDFGENAKDKFKEKKNAVLISEDKAKLIDKMDQLLFAFYKLLKDYGIELHGPKDLLDDILALPPVKKPKLVAAAAMGLIDGIKTERAAAKAARPATANGHTKSPIVFSRKQGASAAKVATKIAPIGYATETATLLDAQFGEKVPETRKLGEVKENISKKLYDLRIKFKEVGLNISNGSEANRAWQGIAHYVENTDTSRIVLSKSLQVVIKDYYQALVNLMQDAVPQDNNEFHQVLEKIEGILNSPALTGFPTNDDDSIPEEAAKAMDKVEALVFRCGQLIICENSRINLTSPVILLGKDGRELLYFKPTVTPVNGSDSPSNKEGYFNKARNRFESGAAVLPVAPRTATVS